MELTPAEFLDHHNPMFEDGEKRLSTYTTAVTDFNNSCFQILLINNSQTPIGNHRLLGVLHTAEIVTPNPDQMRVVNSTMIGCDEEPNSGGSENDVSDFISTDVIRRAAYR